MTGVKHHWTIEEDKLCCRRYLEIYSLQISNMTAGQFINMLQKELPSIPINSIKMKVQNIKRILTEKGISDTLTISPLCHYSQQNMQVMEEVLLEMNLGKD